MAPLRDTRKTSVSADGVQKILYVAAPLLASAEGYKGSAGRSRQTGASATINRDLKLEAPSAGRTPKVANNPIGPLLDEVSGEWRRLNPHA